MKSFTRTLYQLLPVVVLLLATVATLWLTDHASRDLFAVGVSGAMFGPLIGLKGRTWKTLQDAIAANSGQPEFFPMTWYDTQLFTSATTVGAMQFFTNTNNDRTMSNMDLAGQFPADEYFDVGEVHVDLIARSLVGTAPAATNANPNQLDDMLQLLSVSRATILLTNRNKLYGPIPLAQLRPLGNLGASAFAGAFVAATSVGYPGKWEGAGWAFEKTLTLGPTAKFGLTIQWPAAVITLTGNYNVRVSLRGQHNRLVS